MEKNKRNKQQVESVAQSIFNFFRYALDLCVCLYMLLMIVVMPFYNEEGYTHIGTDKSTFYRTCAVYGSRIIIPLLIITVIFWIIMVLQERKEAGKKLIDWNAIIVSMQNSISLTDCFAAFYGIFVIFSYLFSNYKDEALWGTKGWFMGMIPQLTAVAVYFLVSRAWTKRDWMVALILPVSAIVFGLGYINRFGIYPIDMQVELPQFISTIGNINWYCGYVVSVFFGGLYLACGRDWDKKWQLLLLQAYVVIGFATLVTQGSVSGIMTMAIMFVVMFGMSVYDGKRMEMFWAEMILFSLTCLVTYILRAAKILNSTFADAIMDIFTYSPMVIIMLLVTVAFWTWIHFSNRNNRYSQKVFVVLRNVVNGVVIGGLLLFILLIVINTMGDGCIVKLTGPALEGILTFSPEWGSYRGATWMCGLRCLMEQDFLHKLIGVGPDCISAFLYNNGSAELIAFANDAFPASRLTNAHNEWLTVLANIGVFGFISYVGMIISAIKRYIQCYRTNAVVAACGLCVLAYTINNMFSFQQSMSLATIFIILGIGENYLRVEKENE